MSTVNIHPRALDTVVYEETGILYSDFTDAEDATGTYTCGFTLPVGFVVTRSWLTNVTGFVGSSTCTITVGEGAAGDVDRFNTGTPSIFTTISLLDLGAPAGTAAISTAIAPVIIATEDSDWGDVLAGALDIHIAGYMES